MDWIRPSGFSREYPMSDIYSQEFLYYFKNQPHKKDLNRYSLSGKNANISCGDEIEIFLLVQDNIVKDIGYTSQGCAVSEASVSIFSENIIGKNINELKKLTPDDFLKMIPITLTTAREKCALVGYNAFLNCYEKHGKEK